MNPLTAFIRRIRARFDFHSAERLQDSGDLEGAIATYREIAPHFGSDMRAGILNRAGMLAYDLGQFERSRDFYREALDVQPDDPRVHMNLGNALDRLGDRQGAREAYDRALAISRRADVLYNAAVFLADEDPPLALALIRESLESPADEDYPMPAELTLNLLASLGRSRVADEAHRLFEELESNVPAGVEAWCVGNWHGLMLSHAGRHDEALDKLRATLSTWPNALYIEDVHYNLGRALTRMERWNEAIEEFRRVHHTMSYFGTGTVHEARGEHGLAVEQYRLYLAAMALVPAHERRFRGVDPNEQPMVHARDYVSRHDG